MQRCAGTSSLQHCSAAADSDVAQLQQAEEMQLGAAQAAQSNREGLRDVGQADQGLADKSLAQECQRDVGQAEDGQTDVPKADQGQADKGQADEGQADEPHTDEGQMQSAAAEEVVHKASAGPRESEALALLQGARAPGEFFCRSA